jgi:hypothetical protein
VVHLGNEAEVNGEIASSYGQETNSFEDLDALVDKYAKSGCIGSPTVKG